MRLPSTTRRTMVALSTLPLNTALPSAMVTESIFSPLSKLTRKAVLPFISPGMAALTVYPLSSFRPEPHDANSTPARAKTIILSLIFGKYCFKL